MPLDATTLGMLGSMPAACFAVFGAGAGLVVDRIGLEWTAAAVLGVSAVGHILRGLALGAPMMLVATGIVWAACGVGNVVITGLIKRYFPRRINVLTATTGFLFSIGTAGIALVVPAMAQGVGWRVALGSWAVVAVASAMPWIALARWSNPDDHSGIEVVEPEPRALQRAWRSPLARALAVVFAYGAFAVYVYFTWLPKMLIDLVGLPQEQAGLVLAVYGITGVVINGVIIAFGARPAWEIPIMVAGIVCYGAAALGLLLAPGWMPWVWVVVAGLGPFMMQMATVLIGVRARSERETVALGSFVQSVGFGVGFVGPVLVGWLHAMTGGWDIPLILLLVLLIPPAIALRWLGPARSPGEGASRADKRGGPGRR